MKLWRWPGLGLGVCRRPEGVREGNGRGSVLRRPEAAVGWGNSPSAMIAEFCIDAGNVAGGQGGKSGGGGNIREMGLSVS